MGSTLVVTVGAVGKLLPLHALARMTQAHITTRFKRRGALHMVSSSLSTRAQGGGETAHTRCWLERKAIGYEGSIRAHGRPGITRRSDDPARAMADRHARGSRTPLRRRPRRT